MNHVWRIVRLTQNYCIIKKVRAYAAYHKQYLLLECLSTPMERVFGHRLFRVSYLRASILQPEVQGYEWESALARNDVWA